MGKMKRISKDRKERKNRKNRNDKIDRIDKKDNTGRKVLNIALDDKPAINISLDTIKRKKQALIFVNTKRGAEKTAEDISKKINIRDQELEKLSEKILKMLSRPTRQCTRLARCIKKGVAFHHAGLHSKQKELIENCFRSGMVKIIACTPTLAAGLDLPAFRTVLRDLKRFSGKWGYDWIPVLEYEQMSGRAGRPGKESFGESIIIASNDLEKERLKERFIDGRPEKIISKLAVEPVLRMYLLSLIASEIVNSNTEIIGFFERTFWAFQFKDIHALEKKISRILDLIEKYGFIESPNTGKQKSGFVSAKELYSTQTYTATPLGKRVAELYLDPLTADHLIGCIKRASSYIRTDPRRLTEFSLLQMISCTLEIRPLLRVGKTEYEKIEKVLNSKEDNMLIDPFDIYDEEYENFLDSIKTALFFRDWLDEKDEDFLLERYNIRPGEIASKLDIADWLVYTAEEFARILKLPAELKRQLKKLRIRMKYGVREELLALLKLKNIGKVRARTLFNNRIKDIGDVKRKDFVTLAQLIGQKIAIDIKKQVGQDFEKIKIKPKRRVGQISLLDY